MPHALIAFGGNLGDVLGAFRQARARLDTSPDRVLKSSRLYRTAPLRPQVATGDEACSPDIPDYLNAACLLETALSPGALLAQLHMLEQKAGRKRSTRWASRELDLDLLAYDRLVCNEPGLIVPHPHLHERAFVLLPLVDVASDFWLPPDGKTPAALLAVLDAHDVGIDLHAESW